MSDRTDSQRPAADDEDNLDYLDAGLSETFDDDTAPTTAIEQPVRSAVAQGPPPPDTGPVVPPPVRDRSWTWPIVNAVGLVVVIAVNYSANFFEFNGQSTGDVVNKDPVPFQPAGWVFSIWGVIYALLAAFVIYGLLPAGRHDTRLQRISPLFLVANVANATWILLWHYEWFFASLVTILVLLASLLGIYIGLRIRNPIRRSAPVEKPGWFKRLVMWLPFSVYLGWVTVASLANLMVWLDRSDWDGGPFSYNWWAVIFMAGGTLVSAVFAVTSRDVAIPIVMAVAFAGICHHAWDDSILVGVMAIVFAVICVVLAGIAWVVAYDQGSDRGPFGRKRALDTPPPMSHVDDAPIERA